MELDRLSMELERALEDARHLAERRGNALITANHLLYVLLDKGGSLRPVAEKQGIRCEHLLDYLTTRIAEDSSNRKLEGGKRPIAGQPLRDMLDKAYQLADARRSDMVQAADFLAAVLEHGDDNLRKTLREAGFTADSIKKSTESRAAAGEVLDAKKPEARAGSTLERFGRDVTQAAREGKLMPVIGRDAEVRNIIQTLLRKTKNNPVLVGDPGTGKTAIVEALAQRIAVGDAPDSLKKCRLIALDLTSMVAGAKYRGEFEERIKGVVEEVTARHGEIILFLDELHTLVGAGGSAGGLDAANILKPALARGELRCIGATTYDEYRERIAKDAALARRFEQVIVEEPDDETTLTMLRGIRPRYEAHHGVRVSEDALGAIVKLSRRYLRDRFLPDKAIDVLDEAAARIRMQLESKPDDIDELERKLIRVKGEVETLRKSEAPDRRRLREAEDEAEALEGRLAEMNARWNRERETISQLQKTKKAIEEQKTLLEAAEAKSDVAKAAEIRYGTLKYLDQQLADLQNQVADIEKKGFFIRQQVQKEDIAETVARRARIPMARLLESERERMLKLEERIAKRVFGQKRAISAVAEAARMMRTGLRNSKRPSSFLFVGPTGVGKTELTKALAEALFDDESSLIRIDMGEYKESHAAAGLIGSRPGLVGSEEGGFLTEKVRRQPYSVVLFDEVEKAHPEVLDLLLGALGEGRMSDAKGRFCDFSNAIVCFTSNLGVKEANSYEGETEATIALQKKLGLPETGQVDPETRNRIIMEVVKENLRPELFNRLDGVICFDALVPEILEEIVSFQLDRLGKKLKEEQGATFQVDPAAVVFLARDAFDPAYGARPVERTLQRLVLSPLSLMIIGGEVKPNQTVHVALAPEGGLQIKTSGLSVSAGS
jgi:ATP-dependent Clp protease ATP-binding subunit ClpB